MAFTTKNGVVLEQPAIGEWISPLSPHRLQCPECGLVHIVEFEIRDGQIMMRSFPDEEDTMHVRKQMADNIATSEVN